MTDTKQNLLWQYSLECYARPGVAGAMLALQDHYRAEVNILLLCLWAAARGQALQRPWLERARAEIAEGQAQYLLPLRQLRQRLKQHPEPDLYQQAKALELGLEQWQQGQLFALAQQWPPAPGLAGPALARANLAAYAQCLGLGEAPAGTTAAASGATLKPWQQLLDELAEQS